MNIASAFRKVVSAMDPLSRVVLAHDYVSDCGIGGDACEAE